MDDPKRNEAALRVNDPAELDEDALPEDEREPRADEPPFDEIAETSAEAGPELREIEMPEGVDSPDGNRRR